MICHDCHPHSDIRFLTSCKFGQKNTNLLDDTHNHTTVTRASVHIHTIKHDLLEYIDTMTLLAENHEGSWVLRRNVGTNIYLGTVIYLGTDIHCVTGRRRRI